MYEISKSKADCSRSMRRWKEEEGSSEISCRGKKEGKEGGKWNKMNNKVVLSLEHRHDRLAEGEKRRKRKVHRAKPAKGSEGCGVEGKEGLWAVNASGCRTVLQPPPGLIHSDYVRQRNRNHKGKTVCEKTGSRPRRPFGRDRARSFGAS